MSDYSSEIEECIVAALLSHYIPVTQICKYIDIGKDEFKDKYTYLDNFEYCIDLNQAVENSLFQAAVSGNNQSMMFWLKNKALWDDGKTDRDNLGKESDKDLIIEKIQIELISPDENPTDSSD